jgi:predicted membrane channel-forming protein YqfA (hemolysin III family)
MSEKQFYATSNQVVAILLDVLGIILVLVGATIARAHSGTGAGVVLYWIGFVFLIVALIMFVWSMMKPKAEKA